MAHHTKSLCRFRLTQTLKDVDLQRINRAKKEPEINVNVDNPLQDDKHLCKFKCNYCKYYALHGMHLVTHVAYFHKEREQVKNTACISPECMKTFDPQDPYPFKCDFCPFVDKSIAALKSHIENNHAKRDRRLIELRQDTFDNICDECEFCPTTTIDLRKHKLKVHNKLLKFGCSFCSYKTSSHYKLMKHKAYNHNIKPKRPQIIKYTKIKNAAGIEPPPQIYVPLLVPTPNPTQASPEGDSNLLICLCGSKYRRIDPLRRHQEVCPTMLSRLPMMVLQSLSGEVLTEVKEVEDVEEVKEVEEDQQMTRESKEDIQEKVKQWPRESVIVSVSISNHINKTI